MGFNNEKPNSGFLTDEQIYKRPISDLLNKKSPTDLSILWGGMVLDGRSCGQISWWIKSDDTFGQVVDGQLAEELNEKFQAGELNKVGIIDCSNYPMDIPDKDTCDICIDVIVAAFNDLKNKDYLK